MSENYKLFAVTLADGTVETLSADSVSWDSGGLCFYGHNDYRGRYLLRLYAPGTWTRLKEIEAKGE